MIPAGGVAQFQYLVQNIPAFETVSLKFVGQNQYKAKDRGNSKPKEVVCGRCKAVGHGSRECKANIFCIVCNKETHRTGDCTVLKAPKPVAKYVRYGAKGLGCLL